MTTTIEAFKAVALTAGKNAVHADNKIKFEAEDLHALRTVLYARLTLRDRETAINWLATGGDTYQHLVAFLNGASVKLKAGEDWEHSAPTGREPAGPADGVKTTWEAFTASALSTGKGAKPNSNKADWAFDANSLKALQAMFGGLSPAHREAAVNWLATGGNQYLTLLNFLEGAKVWLLPGQVW